MIDPEEIPEQIIEVLKEFTIWTSKARKRINYFLNDAEISSWKRIYIHIMP